MCADEVYFGYGNGVATCRERAVGFMRRDLVLIVQVPGHYLLFTFYIVISYLSIMFFRSLLSRIILYTTKHTHHLSQRPHSTSGPHAGLVWRGYTVH